MAFTFDDTLTSDLGKVRFLCGDVDSTDAQMTDATLTGLVTMYGSVYRAAAAACRGLAARYSRQADMAMDDLRKSLSQRASAYAKRADELESQASSVLGIGVVPMPYAGGLTISGRESVESDPDRSAPFFTRDMMEPSGIGTDSGIIFTDDDD